MPNSCVRNSFRLCSANAVVPVGAALSMMIFISLALFMAIFIMCVKANGRAMNADPYYNGTLAFYCAILFTELAMAATAIFGFIIAFLVWRNNHKLDHRLRQLFRICLACLGISTVATFVLGILGFVRYRQPQEEILALYEIFTENNKDAKFVASFEKYQRENSCCGINGPEDWTGTQLKSQGGVSSGGGIGSSLSSGKCHWQHPTIPKGCGKKILEDIHYTMAVYCAVLVLQTMFATAAGSLGWYCFFYWIEKEVIIIPEDEVSNIIVIEPESSTTTVDPTRSGSSSTLTSDTTNWSRSTILSRSVSRMTSFSNLTQFSMSGSGFNHLNARNVNNGSTASPENFSDSNSFCLNSSRRIDSSRGTKMSNFSGANPSIGGPHSSSFRNKDEIASRNTTNSVLNQSGVLPGVQQSAMNDRIVKSILTGHIQSRILIEQIKPNRPPSSHHRRYASLVHRSHHNNNNEIMPEPGHGQIGHLAEVILEMSGGAAAAKFMTDDINLRVEHDPDGIEEGYVNKLHKKNKEKGGLDHLDADHPGHGQVYIYAGKLTAPSIDGNQAQHFVDALLHPKKSVSKKKEESVIKPHDVTAENGHDHHNYGGSHGHHSHHESHHHSHHEHHSHLGSHLGSHHEHHSHFGSHHSHSHRGHHSPSPGSQHCFGSLHIHHHQHNDRDRHHDDHAHSHGHHEHHGSHHGSHFGSHHGSHHGSHNGSYHGSHHHDHHSHHGSHHHHDHHSHYGHHDHHEGHHGHHGSHHHHDHHHDHHSHHGHHDHHDHHDHHHHGHHY